MAKKYLDYDGLLYFWQKIKVLFVTDVSYISSSRKIQKTKAGTTSDVVTLSKVAVSNNYNDLDNTPTIPTGVEPSTTTPNMDGTAAIGSETKFARGDHVHPSDTTKVDKVAGKGLSTNDYTNADKTKLGGIEVGAEVNVQSDWNVNDAADDAYILHKPTLGTASAKGVVANISGDSTDLPTTTAVRNFVNAQIQTAITGAASFQGTAPTSFAPTNYKKGYYWVVGTAGTYAGQVCEPGDMIFAVEDGTTYSASDFNVVQTNLDITSITNAEIDTIVAS